MFRIKGPRRQEFLLVDAFSVIVKSSRTFVSSGIEARRCSCAPVSHIVHMSPVPVSQYHQFVRCPVVQCNCCWVSVHPSCPRQTSGVCLPPPSPPRGVAELTHTRLRIPAAAARVSAVRVRVVPPLQHPRRCRLWAGNSDQHLDIYTGYLHWISITIYLL